MGDEWLREKVAILFEFCVKLGVSSLYMLTIYASGGIFWLSTGVRPVKQNWAYHRGRPCYGRTGYMSVVNMYKLIYRCNTQ